MSRMAKKKKVKRFSAFKEVKAMARERIGAPGSARVVPDGRKKKAESEKRKSSLARLLQEE